MVFRNMPFDDLNIRGLADLSDQVPNPDRHFPAKHRLAVLGDPHNVILDVIDTMRSLPVVLHNTASLLKSSPKGEGFRRDVAVRSRQVLRDDYERQDTSDA